MAPNYRHLQIMNNYGRQLYYQETDDKVCSCGRLICSLTRGFAPPIHWRYAPAASWHKVSRLKRSLYVLFFPDYQNSCFDIISVSSTMQFKARSVLILGF